MTKILKTGLAVLIAAGAVAAGATPAAADGRWGRDGGRGGWGHEHWEHRGGGDAGALIAGGIAGLALGAALSSSHHNGYYGHRDYRPVYGYRYGDYDDDRVCIERRAVWDPYYGDYVVRPIRYPC